MHCWKKKKSNMAWIQIVGWKIHEVIKYIVGSVLCVIEALAFNNSEICQKKLFIKNKRSAGGTAIFVCSLAQILNCWTLQRNSSYLRGKGSFFKKDNFKPLMILLTVLGTIMQFRMLNETFVADKFTCMTEEWKSHEEVANTGVILDLI